MDDIYEEIQNDLREEKLKTLWNRYKKPLLFTVAGLLVALLIGIGISHMQENKKNEVAHSFLLAQKKLDKGDLEGGLADLQTLIKTTSSPTYRTLARLRCATLPAVSDEGRLKIYEDILQDKETSPAIHDHVSLMKTLILVDKIPETEIPTLIHQLDELKKDSHPLAPLAHELVALLYYRLNRYTEAAQSASQVIAHPEASEQLRMQANAILHESEIGLAKEKGPLSKTPVGS
jgi:hypothetical protein